jgi:hypothetical protein
MNKWGTLRDVAREAGKKHPNVLNVLDLPMGGMSGSPPPRYE